ncbi:MAG: hypothetical protein K8R58_15640, partial [Bacteroidales bacterium]|nr:hypothetical protein [Bacteroidales bacterium]
FNILLLIIILLLLDFVFFVHNFGYTHIIFYWENGYNILRNKKRVNRIYNELIKNVIKFYFINIIY